MYFGIGTSRKEMIEDGSISHLLRLLSDFRIGEIRFLELFENDLVFFS